MKIAKYWIAGKWKIESQTWVNISWTEFLDMRAWSVQSWRDMAWCVFSMSATLHEGPSMPRRARGRHYRPAIETLFERFHPWNKLAGTPVEGYTFCHFRTFKTQSSPAFYLPFQQIARTLLFLPHEIAYICRGIGEFPHHDLKEDRIALCRPAVRNADGEQSGGTFRQHGACGPVLPWTLLQIPGRTYPDGPRIGEHRRL